MSSDPFRCPACRRRMVVEPGFTRGKCPACLTPFVLSGDTKRLELKPGGAPTATGQLAGTLKDGPAVVFCGAGVSMAPPTCAPGWWTLTREIVHAVFTHAPVELPELAERDVHRRPEQVLESFRHLLGDDFARVFGVLDEAPVNATHRALARLAGTGRIRAIFTTNFDTAIERALADEGVEATRCVRDEEFRDYYQAGLPGLAVCKLHGSIDVPETIVYSASQYCHGVGFSEFEALAFARYIAESPLVFLGFSGWDFDHEAYRDFWNTAGPRARAILWNRRPGDTGGPDVESILGAAGDKVRFIESELPGSLAEATRILALPTDDLAVDAQPEEQAQAEADDRRAGYWRDWVGGLPAPHLVGLCITDSFTFSEQYQRIQSSMAGAADMDMSAPMAGVEEMQALAQQMAAGEITLEEFQQQQQDLTIEIQVATLPTGIRDRMRTMMREAHARWPDVSHYTQFLTLLATHARYNEPDVALEKAEEATGRLVELMQTGTVDAGYRMSLITMEAALGGLPDDDAAAAKAELESIVDRVVAGELDSQGYSDELGATMQKWSQRQIGMPDYADLFDALVREALQWSDRGQAADAVVRTLLHAAPMLSQLLTSGDAYSAIVNASSQGGELEAGQLEAAIEPIASRLAPLVDALPEGDVARTGLELAGPAVLCHLVQWTGSASTGEYWQAWQNGDYPRRSAHPVVGDWLRDCFAPVRSRLAELPEAWQQPACALGALIAELADDVELSRETTALALELAGGHVTPQVREPIPESLAAFCERNGDNAEAARYYGMALEGLKLSASRAFADALVYRGYRSVLASGDREAALKVALDYSPAFSRVQSWTKMPCRATLVDEVEALARELGHADADAAKAALGG